MARKKIPTAEEVAQASMGWTLGYVYDLQTSRWLILPSMHSGPANPHAAMLLIKEQAKKGNPIAFRALQTIYAHAK